MVFLHELPWDVLENVFTFLNVEDLNSISRVLPQYLSDVIRSKLIWHTVSFNVHQDIYNLFFPFFVQPDLSAIKHLTLAAPVEADEPHYELCMDIVNALPGLFTLRLIGFYLWRSSAKQVFPPQLQNLSFTSCKFGDSFKFYTFARTLSLRSVAFIDNIGTPSYQELYELCNYSHLNSLRLRLITCAASDDLFRRLTLLKSLKCLQLEVYRKDANFYDVQDGFIGFCKSFSDGLEYLSLRGQTALRPHLLLWLGHLRALTYLNLLQTTVTADVLSELAALPSLKSLYVGGSQLTNDAGGCFTHGFQKLEHLQCSSASMWLQGFSGIADSYFASSLTWACFFACRCLDNKALIYLSQNLSSLTYLDLSHCYNITDKGISGALPNFTSVKQLLLVSCYKLTVESLQTIQNILPDLEVLDVSLIWHISPDHIKDFLLSNTSLNSLRGRKHVEFLK